MLQTNLPTMKGQEPFLLHPMYNIKNLVEVKILMLAHWYQAILCVPESQSASVQEILLDLGALGIQVEDDESRRIPEKPFQPLHSALITATFEPESSLEDKICFALPEYEIKFQILKDADWANEFLKNWRAFSLGNNIWIVPSWDQDFQAPPNSLVLHMDPGMAFGTGHHETTTLCAQAVLKAVQNGKKHVLDIGTGTGILAMIAAKAGAQKIIGTDNNPVACQVARENLKKNELDFEITEKEPHYWGPQFDLVVANILANPLIELAPQIIQAIVPNGLLLLSGILNSQAYAIQTAYESLGLKYIETQKLGDWVLIKLYL